MLEIIEAKYIKDYVIWLKFNNGASGTVNLKDHLWGPVFEPLKDLKYFKDFRVSRELGTVCWNNEADIAPEFLLENLELAQASDQWPGMETGISRKQEIDSVHEARDKDYNS